MRRCLLPALLLLQLGCGQNPGGGGKPPPLTGKQRERAAQRLLLDLPTVEEKLVGAASYGNLTLMTELLAAGAVVDAMPSLEAVAVVTGQVPGATPLGAAVIGNHPKCVLALLQAGADPLLLVEGGLRLAPLFIAASSNDPGMLKAMFKGGANLSAAGGDGFTALHWVAMAGKSPRPSVPILRALRLLVEDGDGPKLDPSIRASSPASDWPGLAHGMAGAVARSTPLMEAAKRANLGAAKLLLEAGATGPWRYQGTVALVDSLGRSALHYAALSGGTEDADALAEVLLAAGADPHLKDNHGDTPASIVAAEREAIRKEEDAAAEMEWREKGIPPGSGKPPPPPVYPSFERSAAAAAAGSKKKKKSKKQRRLEAEWEAEREEKEALRLLAEQIGGTAKPDL